MIPLAMLAVLAILTVRDAGDVALRVLRDLGASVARDIISLLAPLP